MKIINGLPYAPYFIFIKGITCKTNKEIFQLLQLENRVEVGTQDEISGKDCLYISRDKNWVHLMDNYYYNLWHSQVLSNRIEELGKELEIFTCSVGDCDLSFDFKYYKGGTKVREYVVESPNYNDELLKVNYGLPLPSEKEGLKRTVELDRVIYIATSLGIELPKKLKEIRCYKTEIKYNTE